MNTTDNIADWITLAHAPAIGIRTIQKSLEHFASVTEICRATTSTLKHHFTDAQIQAIKHPDSSLIQKTLSWLQQDTPHHVIPFTSQEYPPLLLEIAQAPSILYLQGDLSALSQPQIALVGSRNPTHTGLEYATAFAFALAKQGFCIASGLALGIDGAAHLGALEANGTTLAVLGTGLDNIYPKRHLALAEKITQHGCLVSEFSLGTPPSAPHFPRRNRIISGLCLGTVVIEAALKSGSLITARYALEQNREVFALPGSLRNPNALGCLKLIQDGACCVTSIEDILNEINQLHKFVSSETPSVKQLPVDFHDQPVLACVDRDAITTIDQICERSKLPARQVIASLTALELQGCITAAQGGYIVAGTKFK